MDDTVTQKGFAFDGMQARIKETRKARNMSLDDVAASSGFTKSHVWELEQGKSRNPTVRAVWGLSKALGVSPAWLLGLDPSQSAIDPLALEIAALIERRIKGTTRIAHQPDSALAEAVKDILRGPEGEEYTDAGMEDAFFRWPEIERAIITALGGHHEPSGEAE